MAGKAIQKEVIVSKYGLVVMVGLLLLVSLASAVWEQLTSGTRAELLSVHFPTGTQVGYAVGTDTTGYGTILKTTNGGNTWVQQTSGMENGVYGVCFLDDSFGYAVSGGTLLRTSDGGATWNPRVVPGMQRLCTVQFPKSGPTGYIVANPQGGGGRLLKTADGGDNWTAIPVGGPMNTSLGGGFATDSIGVVVGYRGFIIGSTDGFDSIKQYQGAQTNADLSAAAFSPEDPNRGYLVGSDTTRGVVRYTDDGGASLWQVVRCSVVTALCGVDMPTSDVAYVCGTGGFIGRTVSATDIWATSVPAGLTATMHGLCFPNGPDTGYAVGLGGTILRTYDGGVPLIPDVAEWKAPAVSQSGIRVLSNPSRHGITFRADADVDVVVFDATGRVVARQPATRGFNFLPLSKAGVYYLREAQAQAQAVRVVLTE